MFDRIPRVEIKRRESSILLQSSGAKSNDFAIKFEYNSRYYKIELFMLCDQIEPCLGKEKAYISIGFRPELSERKIICIVCSSASNTL